MNINNIKTDIKNIITPPESKFFLTPSVKLPDYDQNDSKEKIIAKFKADLSENLKVPVSDIEVIFKDGHLRAKYKEPPVVTTSVNDGDAMSLSVEKEGKTKEVVLKFVDNEDFERFASYAVNSKDTLLADLGKAGKTIRIPDYNNNLLKADCIKLFKEDVARLVGAAVENIGIRAVGDELFVSVIGTNKRIAVKFADGSDGNRIIKIAKESKSVLLKDLGEKKIETETTSKISTSFPDSKSKTKISNSVDSKIFLDEQAIHRIKVGVNTETAIENQPLDKVVNRLTFAYENAIYGSFEMNYDPSKNKFGIKGDSQYLNKKLEKFKDKLLDKDHTAMLITAGALVATGGLIVIAANALDKETSLDLPISGKIYDNGTFSLNGELGGILKLGNHKLGLEYGSTGIETKENISSGFSSTQKVKYDNKEKKLESELKLEYKGLTAGFNNKHSFKNENDTISHVIVGFTHPLFKGINSSITYQQDFDHSFNSLNHNLATGFTFAPRENINLSLNGDISMPDIHKKPVYGASFAVNIKF